MTAHLGGQEPPQEAVEWLGAVVRDDLKARTFPPDPVTGLDTSGPVTVRAHNLRDALLVAAALPLSDWFEDEEPTP